MERWRMWALGTGAAVFSSSEALAPHEVFQFRSAGAGCLALESLPPPYDRRYVDKASQGRGGGGCKVSSRICSNLL